MEQCDDAPEPKIVGTDFNLGPDAEERLRRLFIILLKLADDELPFQGRNRPLTRAKRRTDV